MPTDEHRARTQRNEQLIYDFVMPKPDPWYERYLFLSRTISNVSHTFTLETNAVSGGDDANITARVITLSDFGAGADHRVELVHSNAGAERVLDSQQSDGYAIVELKGTLSASALMASNAFSIRLIPIDDDPNTGEPPTHWLGSAVYFDRADLTYTTQSKAKGNVLHWTEGSVDGNGYDGFTVSGFSRYWTLGYAYSNGSLVYLVGNNRAQAPDGKWQVTFPQIDQDDVTYWVSQRAQLHEPVTTNPVIDAEGLATGNADYVIIAHPTFLDRLTNPDTSNGEQDFLQNKESHGHRTPEAIQSYLIAESQANASLQYVLLVGNASRDPNDYTGNGSWNLIPTFYDTTHYYLHYAPNDGRLADTDGDGYQNLAIGRWPVRTKAELNTLINKTIAYTDGTDTTVATKTLNTAVLAADVNDDNDFTSQMDSVAGQLERAGFTATKVYKDDGGTSQNLIDAINAGQSITSYSGHASPSQWSYNGLLRYNQVDQLINSQHPTLMLPLSCYTTYTVSEHTDTLGQRLMSSEGGAVALMGAASLSNYGTNQRVITEIMQSMTRGVDTNADGTPDITFSLGEAVKQAKLTTSPDNPVNISGNLIGDPTIKISVDNSTRKQSAGALRTSVVY